MNNSYKEEDAKEKQCPDAIYAFAGGCSANRCDNSYAEGAPWTETTKCIASNCMAWMWEEAKQLENRFNEEKIEPSPSPDTIFKYIGFKKCHNLHEWEEWEAPTKGYCGRARK